MKTVRLCAVVGGILASCLNSTNADGQFQILGDASFSEETQSVVAVAYQEDASVPPAPAATDGSEGSDGGEQFVVPPPGAPYGYHTPMTPNGPMVIENGWSDVWGQSIGGWCAQGAVFAGVEGTFLAPLDEPQQSVIFTDLTDGRTYRGENDPTLGAGVRTWLGLQQCGTGIRARYWYFGNTATNPEPELPRKAGPGFIESYMLQAQTFDIEVFHEFCFCHGTIDTSFGARYAHLNRLGSVSGFGTVGDVDLLGLAMGANEMEGTGFTASIGGRKPLCCFGKDCCDSCNACCAPPCGLNFIWNARYSLLWADASVTALTDASAIVKPPFGAAAASSRDGAQASMQKDTLSIAEFQLGLEYTFSACCLPGIFSLRGGLEYQHWDTGDVTAGSTSAAFLAGNPPPFGGQTVANSNAHDGDLDLLGFFLGAQWKF